MKKNQKAILKTIPFLLLIILLSVVSGCIKPGSGSCDFEQQLYANGSDGNSYNTVIFPSCGFPETGGLRVEVIVESIIGTGADIKIFTSDQDEGTISWFESREHNELVYIYPDKEYYFYVDHDCILKLGGLS